MALKKLLYWALFGGAACVPLQATNLFVMPSGASTTTNVYNAETFTAAGSLQASPAAFLALPTPLGTKYYIVARSATDTIVVANSSFARVQGISLPSGAAAAALSPDGNRLLVAAGSSLRIYSTATDAEIASLDVGGAITDVAVAHDSSRAFVLSAALQRLMAVDLTTNALTGTYTISSAAYPATGVVVGPNGLVYLSGQNLIFEIDGRTMALRPGGEMSAAGRPGRLTFTPDGNYALAVNQVATLTNSLLMRVDLRNRTVTSLPAFGPLTGVTLSHVVATSNNRAFAVSQGQKLYELSLDPLAIDETLLRGSANAGVTAIAISSEFPQARYLFVAVQSSVQRYDLATNQLTGTQGPLAYVPGSVAFAGQSSLGPVVNLAQYNNSQLVPAGGTSLPLIVRAADVFNRPVYGAPVTFVTSMWGVSITNVTPNTGADGYAQATVTLTAAVAGTVPVVASVGGVFATFFITPGGAGPGEVGGLQIAGGNGQVVHQWNPVARRPLTVVVKDPSGTPVAGVPISWRPSPDGSALLSSTLTYTDSDGEASVLATAVVPGIISDYAQAAIIATAPDGSAVTFYLTILAMTQGGAEQVPRIQILPAEDLISGRAGQTLSGAIQVLFRTEYGRGVPNVGVELIGNRDPALGPVAACSTSNLLTDLSGYASCDLVLGRSIGVGQIAVLVGNVPTYGYKMYNLEVLPGDPASIAVISGDGQTGSPGQTLPQLLVAEVRDVTGNPLVGVSVLWEFGAEGTGARLSNAATVTDSSGRVSATVTLGPKPGDLVVRVRAAANLSVVAAFTVRGVVPVAALTKISGDGQTAVINQAFAAPLVVEVRDTQGLLLPNVTVAFAVTAGSATLGSATALTNSQGRASMTVQAGAAAGSITVSATADSYSVTFNLTSRLPGPTLTASSFLNGASYRQGLVPGAVTAIVGDGLAPGLDGCMGPGTVVGPLPTKVAGVEVLFGATAAPIYAVCNVYGQESVIVQAPWGMAPGFTVMATVKVGGGVTVVEKVPVLAALPGIFETIGADGKGFAVAVAPDGVLISPAKPAKKGDIVRFYATGLGVVLPLATTNQPGFPGQKVWFPVIAGIGGKGVRVVSAELAVNMIGVYEIAIEIPLDAPSGAEVALDLAAVTIEGMAPVFAATSKIAIQ